MKQSSLMAALDGLRRKVAILVLSFLAVLPPTFASPSRKPSPACPVGRCMREALGRVFASAQSALQRDLEETTLADLIDAVKTSGARARKRGI